MRQLSVRTSTCSHINYYALLSTKEDHERHDTHKEILFYGVKVEDTGRG